MIYQHGKLGYAKYSDVQSLWNNYISNVNKWLTGTLVYDQTDRNIYFYPYLSKIENYYITESKPIPNEIVFNIEKTKFELIKHDKYHYRLVLITTENNKNYLFSSEIHEARNFRKQLMERNTTLFNNSIFNVINHIKSNL